MVRNLWSWYQELTLKVAKFWFHYNGGFYALNIPAAEERISRFLTIPDVDFSFDSLRIHLLMQELSAKYASVEQNRALPITDHCSSKIGRFYILNSHGCRAALAFRKYLPLRVSNRLFCGFGDINLQVVLKTLTLVHRMESVRWSVKHCGISCLEVKL